MHTLKSGLMFALILIFIPVLVYCVNSTTLLDIDALFYTLGPKKSSPLPLNLFQKDVTLKNIVNFSSTIHPWDTLITRINHKMI